MAKQKPFKVKGPLGTGKRFGALQRRLGKRPGVEDPDALAAAIGRKKHGATRMAKMAGKARRRKAANILTLKALRARKRK